MKEGLAPRITLQPINQQTRSGDKVRIRCEVSGPGPFRVHWTRVNPASPSQSISILSSELPAQVLQSYLTQLHVVQQNDTLLFDGVRPEDEGSYLCTAVNSAGKAEAVADLYVRTGAPVSDDLIDLNDHEKMARVGQDVRLVCPLIVRISKKVSLLTFC